MFAQQNINIEKITLNFGVNYRDRSEIIQLKN